MDGNHRITSMKTLKNCEALTAFLYVRQYKIEEAFIELRYHSDFPLDLNELFDYFYSTYIEVQRQMQNIRLNFGIVEI